MKLCKVDMLDHRVSLAECGIGAAGNVEPAIAPPTASSPRSSLQPAHNRGIDHAGGIGHAGGIDHASVTTIALRVLFAHTNRWSSSLAALSCTGKHVPRCHMHNSPGPVEA